MKNKKLLWQLPFLTFLIVATFLIIHQQRSVPYQRSTDFIFGTTFHITYQCDSDLTPYIKAELMKVDNSLSPFNKSSIITALIEGKVSDRCNARFYVYGCIPVGNEYLYRY